MSPSAAVESTPSYHAFMSYSRRDTAIAQALIERLESNGRSIAYDRDDIHDGEAWRRKLTALIQQSQNIIVLISQASLDSRECRWELDLAGTLNKRLVTVRIDAVAPGDLPESLGAIQWIDATATRDLDTVAARIIAALDIDQQWAERHTHLTFQAMAWRENGTLLRGAELRDAEAMVATYQGKQPLPTAEHMALLLASRKASARRLRLAVLGTAAVGVVLAVLSVNWLAERRNAEYTGLRRQAEAALNQAEGDLPAALASLGYVVRADTQGLLPEYRDVVTFWQAQLRAIDEIFPGMKVGEPLQWRATLHVKNAAQGLRPLAGGIPMLVAPSEDGKTLATADYANVSLLSLPGLEPLVQFRLGGRVQPDSIVAIPATGWLLAAGTQTVVNNDEDEPVSIYDCFTLLLPDAGGSARPVVEPGTTAEDADYATKAVRYQAGANGSAAWHFCPQVNMGQISVAADTSRRYLSVGEPGAEPVAQLMIDLQTNDYINELPATTAWDPRTRATMPEGASRVHTFAQVRPQVELWYEAHASEREQWQRALDAPNDQQAQAQQRLDTADTSALNDEDQAVLGNLHDPLGYLKLINEPEAVFVWGLYIAGNSNAAFGICRIAGQGQRLEWCKQRQFLAIESTQRFSADQRWAAITNRDGWSSPLELIELKTLARSELKELPSLVAAQAFDPTSTRLALLSETNELWLYTLAPGTAPRLLQHSALGEAGQERCKDPDAPQQLLPATGSIDFAGERFLVGLGTDGVLFGFDTHSGDLTWRRPVQNSMDRCAQGLEVSAAGDFFALHGRSVVQLFHGLSGVPLTRPLTTSELTGTTPEEGYFDHVQITPTGELSLAVGERVFVRPRPPQPVQTSLEPFTGISDADGRTPLKALPGPYER